MAIHAAYSARMNITYAASTLSSALLPASERKACSRRRPEPPPTTSSPGSRRSAATSHAEPGGTRRGASLPMAGLPLQCSQRFGGVAAHPGRKEQQQWPGPTQYLGPLDHPDTPSGHRLKHVIEDDLAQRHRALTDPPPSGIDRGDGEGAAQVAALPGPAARARLERAIELRDLLADIPFGPAGYVGPHLPDRVRVGLKGRLAFKQVHDCPSEARPGYEPADHVPGSPVPACYLRHATPAVL